MLSLDYVPDGLPGKTPSKIGSIQSRCNELKARTKENTLRHSRLEENSRPQADWLRIETDWPGIEAVARSSNKGETVDSGTLNIPDWPRIEAVAESYLEERRNSGQWHSSRYPTSQESKPLLSLDYVPTDCLAKHLQRLGVYSQDYVGQESKPLLSLDYVPDGLPGKTPSKIGSIQSRCNELKARTKENTLRHSRLANKENSRPQGATNSKLDKGETVDSGNLRHTHGQEWNLLLSLDYVVGQESKPLLSLDYVLEKQWTVALSDIPD
ncbi:unnamed protein product [Rodentolepis nana]|uniref:Uncharacterized protein n=1 Tax=Rodentolepis nana TaxID=102285 RepID=A0A3P7TP76_RODNA|nr:unnamed protein product [Rodentolepis nana]